VSTPTRSAARRVATARTISLTGTAAASIALLFVIYQRTHSSAWIAASLLVTLGVQGVVSPFAGALGDRFSRRRVMIVSDLAGAGCYALMAFVRSPAGLLGVAFLAVLAESAFSPAASAALPNLVVPEDLTWANGTIAFGSSLGYVAGPALGGLLVAGIGAPTVFLLNTASFVLSAGLVASVHGSFSAAPDTDEEGRHEGVRAGFVFLWREPVLRRTTMAFAVFAVSVGSILVAELPLATSLGAGALGFGLMSTAFDFGALFGALAARRVPERRELTWLTAGSFVTAASFASVAGWPTLAPILIAMTVGGSSDGLVDVIVSVIYQRRSPDAVRSRVMAALDSVFLVGLALAFPVGGVLVDHAGPRVAYAVAGVGCTITALLLFRVARDGAAALPAVTGEPAIQ
jgi:MFS family permease